MWISGCPARYVASEVVAQRGAPTIKKFGRPPFSLRRAVFRAGSSMASHLVRGRYTQQPQCVRERDLRRARQVQTRLGQRRIVGDHAAVAVESVEIGGELFRVTRDPVRRAQARGDLHGLGELGDLAEE